MILIQKQKIFTQLVAKLLQECASRGYEVTFGETWRPPETAKFYSESGEGVANSLHCFRLAVDLNLFKDGIYLRKTPNYLEMGDYWKSLSTVDYTCCWGGDWGKDGNHFSLEHNGVR